MIDDQWSALLRSWSQHILATSDYQDYLPEEVIDEENFWIGYLGASEEQICQTEERLRIELPPSYRSFLSESNGWHTGMGSESRFFGIQEVD